jgi:mRNA interferase RelE/StbE
MSSWSGRGAATRIYSPGYDAEFWALPAGLQARIESKLDSLGGQLSEFPHHRLKSSPDYRLRIGDYRIIYSFNLEKNQLFLLSLGHRSQIYR